ncbi:MAG: N-acetylneuraminate synthase family protein, partial [Phycisphaerae bacterium]|nr:N-acetylneuraminate synthase family protein [Phycisphaerae bacterium]
AAEAGADAVKLQLFDSGLLLSGEAELAGYQSSMGDPRSMLDRLQLDATQMRQVRDRAGELGLGFIVTFFSLELLEQMASLDPDAIKIASPDCVNLPLIEAASALDRPILMSLGTVEEADDPLVDRAVASLAHRALVLLHCVSAYPVPEGAANLGRIAALQRRYLVPVGYSDHAGAEHMGMLAVAAGACLIEKHLTHDRTAPGPDHAASFEPPQLRRYIEGIERAHRELAAAAVDGLEADVRRVSRQSICARRNLCAGDRLQRADLTLKRPGTGIGAALLDEVVGRRLARDVGADTLLRDADLEQS